MTHHQHAIISTRPSSSSSPLHHHFTSLLSSSSSSFLTILLLLLLLTTTIASVATDDKESSAAARITLPQPQLYSQIEASTPYPIHKYHHHDDSVPFGFSSSFIDSRSHDDDDDIIGSHHPGSSSSGSLSTTTHATVRTLSSSSSSPHTTTTTPRINSDGDTPQHDIPATKKQGLSDYKISIMNRESHQQTYQPKFQLKQIQFSHAGLDKDTWNSSPISASVPVRAHYISLQNPWQHFSIQSSQLGCGHLATVQQSAIYHKCILATNAGFFNTHSGECLGSVITSPQGRYGTIEHISDVTNPNFGITQDGKYVVGYMSQHDIQQHEWKSLISGVIWLVKDGRNHVSEALNIEEGSTQESGTFRKFVNIRASRTAIGHKANGELIILQLDGDGNTHTGADLYEMASKLIELGAEQAINLDGGGSSTTVVNGEIVSSVSDGCGDGELEMFRCPRPVSTITCIHNAQGVRPPHDEEESQKGDDNTSDSESSLNLERTIGNIFFAVFGSLIALFLCVAVSGVVIIAVYQLITLVYKLDNKRYARLEQDDLEMERFEAGGGIPITDSFQDEDEDEGGMVEESFPTAAGDGMR